MAILDSSSLGSLVQHVKAYVTNQINVTLNTRTISKATSDAQGNVISDTYATKTYANTAINTAVNNLSSSSNFLKSASVDGNTLTITKGNNSDVTYTPDLSWSNVTNKPSVFTPDSHNHGSNDINAMTGYSKPNSTSAISTSDTLNQAIGKLEKNDSNIIDMIPTNVSDLTNDTGFITGISWNEVTNKPLEFPPESHTHDKLSTARTIDGVLFDGSAAIVHYGTCSTAAATVAKTVACTSFTLVTGSRIIVKFTVTNTAANPTLNVNNTGDKAIQYRGAAIAAGYLAANRTYEFIYDGTNYQLVGDIDTNSTYSAMTASELTTGTATTARSITAKVLQDEFKPRSIEYIKGTQTAATGSFTGVTKDAALYDGKTIFYYLPYAGSGNATLNLTLSGGTTTGEKSIYWTGTSALTTHYGAGSVISLTYVSAKDAWCRADYNSNTTYTAMAADEATTGTATTARSITAKVLHDKVTQASYYYGSCSTDAATVAKTVNITGFKLTTGVRVVVKFTVTNSAANPTLNVTSTGAKAIYYRSAAITAGYLAANRTYEFVYNGTQYELVGDVDTNSTGYLPTTGGTVSGTVVLSKTTDASGTANNSPALIVGGAATAAHMELDADEIMAKTNGTSVKAIYMNNDGGAVYLCNAATGVYLNASNGLLPRTTKKLTLGGSSNLWTTVYASTATISTSDKRLKDLINNIPDDVLDVWDKINWQQFKMKDSISEKGIENARLHTGLVAQDVEKVFNDNNLDPRKYGFFCFDKWDAEPAVYSASGKLMQEAKEAGESFSIRYEEALVIEAAYQRRKNKQLEDRIKDLEDKIQQLLNNNSVN